MRARKNFFFICREFCHTLKLDSSSVVYLRWEIRENFLFKMLTETMESAAIPENDQFNFS